MSWISVAVAAFGTLSSAAAANAGRQNANTAGDMARQSGEVAMSEGFAREQATRRRGAQSLGRTAAASAESGFDPSSGSSADVISQSAKNVEFDAMMARYQGLQQSWQFGREESIDRSRAQAATQAGYWNAGGSVLSSFADYYGRKRPLGSWDG